MGWAGFLFGGPRGSLRGLKACSPLTHLARPSRGQPAFCQHLFLQSPRQLGGEYKEAWKIHKLHNQPLHLGRLTLFIASCPRKPFPNRLGFEGGEPDLVGGLPLPDVREQAASLNKLAPFHFSLPPPREQGLSKSTRGPPKRRAISPEGCFLSN